MIDSNPKDKLTNGYHRLISSSPKNESFAMYCYMKGERIHITGCVFDELNGLLYTSHLNRSVKDLTASIERNIISQKKYLFNIFNKGR